MRIVTQGLCALLLGAGATGVLAQTNVGQAAIGAGIAVYFNPITQERDGFQVRFEVHKRPVNGQPVVRGTFSMDTVTNRADPTPDRRFSLLAREIGFLRVDANKAVFEGPATLRHRGPRGVVTVHGSVRVQVEDNRGPAGATETPDKIVVKFTSRDGALVREIPAVMFRGDIRVVSNN
ncbi:MAG: hypothetical protein KIS66_10565 [Fimbriimonadaceae bacterium]|nr:hypothetical protein [Fimbriimonadaceae bacterium]